jgi:nucleoside-diphosphate-sugar epimerase
MMYMPDAIRATLELMEAPAEKVKIRSSYNLGGISFTPKEIAAEIAKHVPVSPSTIPPTSVSKSPTPGPIASTIQAPNKTGAGNVNTTSPP